jgi:NNP family nitrate/nitrite transporter-like MFS transporter
MGNLGVGLVQAVVPLVIYAGAFTILGGDPQTHTDGGVVSMVWLQNAGFAWIPFIIGATIVSALGQDNIQHVRATFTEQCVIFRRKHAWLLAWLYTGTFGSFIGLSAAFPMLLYALFPQSDIVRWAFVGPVLGALARPLGGWLSDRIGGARVSFWNFVVMLAATIGVVATLPTATAGNDPTWIAVAFMVLFVATGIGNGSVFRLVPSVFHKLHATEPADAADDPGEAPITAGEIEASVVLGFTASVAALGLFFIPALIAVSIDSTGTPRLALYVFVGFYATCLFATWWWYRRPGAEVKCR